MAAALMGTAAARQTFSFSNSSSIASTSMSSSSSSNSSQSATASLSNSRSVSLSGSATGTASQSATRSAISASRSATRASGSGSSTAPSATSTASPTFLTFDGVLFKIEINITYSGVTFDIELDLAKRAGMTLDDCLTACSANTTCKGTAFDSSDDTCTYYSSIDTNSRTDAPGITFATVESRAGQNSTSSSSASSNSTASSTGSSAIATPTGLEGLICPKYNGMVVNTPLDVDFVVECNHGIIGDALTIEASRKRQDTGLPTSISNCVDICSTETACVATTFDYNTNTCAYYSTFQLVVAQGMDAALRLENNGAGSGTTTVTQTLVQTTTIFTEGGSTVQTATVTSTAVVCPTCAVTSVPAGANGGALSTATVFQTTVVTISSCAPTVTDCPLRAGQNAAVVTTVVPVSETVYQCPYPTNANYVTAVYGAVTEMDVVTSTVYSCPAGQTITVSGTQMVPAQPTTITEYYTTHVTQSSSAAPPAMTGDNASKSVVYVQQIVSAGPTATYTQYVVVSTAPPAPQQTTATITQGCDGVHCPAGNTGAATTTYKITINTVIPQQSAPAQCNGVNCPSNMTSASSGMTTSAYATATVSKPLAFTGAGSIVSVQGGVVAIAAAVFSVFLF
ncbi:hypothetical protein E4T48_03520 [Aureobasidium sp. EXF-10727]|nr:hypothetical protein E4T48_03520 [Aureobasidium sp. EXF-10727]